MNIAVIGAGAAGLMAAYEASKNCKVLLFEKNEKVGKKIYITGKGRCNVTNMCEPNDFFENIVNGKKFMMSAINAFPPVKTVEFLEYNGVKTKVERGRRVFPVSDKSSDVISAFVRSLSSADIETIYEAVKSIKIVDGGFEIITHASNNYFADKVILACGGVTYPLTGSTGDGYEFAKKLGHTIKPLVPALVPIKLKQDVTNLQGLSLKNVKATIVVDGKIFSQFGEMLFTDKGVSGPIILTLSSFINRLNLKNARLYIDLKPSLDKEILDKRILHDFELYKNKQYKNALDDLLPKKLIQTFIEFSGIPGDKKINSVSRAERARILDLMKNMVFDIEGLDDIKYGIVTSGGVDLSEINPKTMESKIVKGLFIAGEMLDIDALTGGYNLQLAFSTGYVAGKNAGGNK